MILPANISSQSAREGQCATAQSSSAACLVRASCNANVGRPSALSLLSPDAMACYNLWLGGAHGCDLFLLAERIESRPWDLRPTRTLVQPGLDISVGKDPSLPTPNDLPSMLCLSVV